MKAAVQNHGRYVYSDITTRPTFDWPGGRRLAIYIGLNAEVFAFGGGLGAELAPGGPQPDVLNYAWRDYGNRVGLPRLREMLDRLGMPCTVLANALSYTQTPGLIESFAARGDEIAAHGRTNAERQGTLSEPDEARLIAETTAILTAREGKPPEGWLGPWISQSAVTPDLLHEAGYRYLLDWCHDDQPVWMRTRQGRILSVPYPQELNDIPQIVARKQEARAFAEMIVDAFDAMLAESTRRPLVMGIALHGYLMGQTHRIGPLEHVLRHIRDLGDDRVWFTTAGAIARHYAAV